MAQNLEVSIRIKADVESALRAVRGLGKEAGDAAKGADRLGKEAGDAAKDVDRLGDEAAGAAKDMDRAARTGERFKSTVGRLVTGDLLARGITSLARQVVEFGRSSLEAAIALDSVESAMLAATGSASTAARELEYVRSEARRLGIDLLGAEQAYVKLTAATRGTALEGRATRDIFTAVAEASRVMGLTAEQQAGALTAIEQIMSKGKVSAEELRGQLGERLPGAFRLAARAMGVTTAELDEMLVKGELLAEDFLPAFARELRSSVAGGLQDALDGPAAALGRFQVGILELKRALADSGILEFFAKMATYVGQAARGASDILNAATRARARRRLPGLRRDLSEAVGEQETRGRAYNVAAGVHSNAVDEQRAAQEAFDRASAAARKDETGFPPPEVTNALTHANRTLAGISRAAQDALVALQSADNRVEALRKSVAAAERAAEFGTQDYGAFGGDPRGDPGGGGADSPAATSAAGPSAAEAYLDTLRRQRLSVQDLTRVERLRADIAAGRLGPEKDLTAEIRDQLVAAAEALDAADQEKRSRAESKRLARERKEDAEEAARDHKRAAAEIGDALASPHRRAVREAERWRTATLAALDETAEGYDALAAQVEEVYRDRIAEAARDAAEAEREAAEERLRAATDLRSGIERGLADLARESADFASQAEQAVTGAFRGMEDALVSFVQGGKLEFASLANSIVADLTRIAVRTSITGPLAGWLGGLFGGGGGVAAAGVGDLPGTSYGTAHTGGVVGALGARRSGVHPGVFAGAPRFHAGGVVGLRSDEVPIIARRGERILTPEQASARAAPPSVTIHIENRTGGEASANAEDVRFDGDRLVAGVVLEDLGRRGPIARAIRQLR